MELYCSQSVSRVFEMLGNAKLESSRYHYVVYTGSDTTQYLDRRRPIEAPTPSEVRPGRENTANEGTSDTGDAENGADQADDAGLIAATPALTVLAFIA
ncbi:hypothetical protein CIB48_g11730 [Xylaria polymorpha]|nr:hypothetical protein CIB48_g11730 [Xylaria polymorpha]